MKSAAVTPLSVDFLVVWYSTLGVGAVFRGELLMPGVGVDVAGEGSDVMLWGTKGLLGVANAPGAKGQTCGVFGGNRQVAGVCGRLGIGRCTVAHPLGADKKVETGAARQSVLGPGPPHAANRSTECV